MLHFIVEQLFNFFHAIINHDFELFPFKFVKVLLPATCNPYLTLFGSDNDFRLRAGVDGLGFVAGVFDFNVVASYLFDLFVFGVEVF